MKQAVTINTNKLHETEQTVARLAKKWDDVIKMTHDKVVDVKLDLEEHKEQLLSTHHCTHFAFQTVLDIVRGIHAEVQSMLLLRAEVVQHHEVMWELAQMRALMEAKHS